jgi:hypothetical protein
LQQHTERPDAPASLEEQTDALRLATVRWVI